MHLILVDMLIQFNTLNDNNLHFNALNTVRFDTLHFNTLNCNAWQLILPSIDI